MIVTIVSIHEVTVTIVSTYNIFLNVVNIIQIL